MLMGLLVRYVNPSPAPTSSCPYAQYLHCFLSSSPWSPTGSVRWDGSPVTTETGEVFGVSRSTASTPSTSSSTRALPAHPRGLSSPANPAHPTKDGGGTSTSCSCPTTSGPLQGRLGKTADEVRAEGTAEEIVLRVCRQQADHLIRPGADAFWVVESSSPPTSTISPSPRASCVGLVDSFDQWGWEEKRLEIAPCRPGADEGSPRRAGSASTRGLTTRYCSLRRQTTGILCRVSD